ncbi:hypothetical protein [Streptomyces noursei]|uniref:phage tail tube protein n=1 Tax=Streptomyces noursei TaxID=1971 RepID=UPI0016742BD9|nr:hypothetical protein [Streptomyces noursei]MCZ1015611.1 hypothetical protein [Streptomyces noursei]GGW89456.1 hypothetical protein GCM10010341_07840 [Streptomyces noursei]
MANDAAKIRFAPNGGLFMAPAPGPAGSTTVLPTDVGDGKAPPEGYKGLGYVDEGGVTITPSIETDPVNVWQSAVPVLYNVKSAAFQVKATLMEFNQLTTELFFGAKWVPVKDNKQQDTGTYRLDLSSTPELSELSLVVDWSQKGILYRCVMPRAMVSDRGAIQLQRAESGKFELTIDALDSNGRLGYVLTNDDVLNLGITPPPNGDSGSGSHSGSGNLD